MFCRDPKLVLLKCNSLSRTSFFSPTIEYKNFALCLDKPLLARQWLWRADVLKDQQCPVGSQGLPGDSQQGGKADDD